MKKRIRLSESQLRKVIKEAIKEEYNGGLDWKTLANASLENDKKYMGYGRNLESPYTTKHEGEEYSNWRAKNHGRTYKFFNAAKDAFKNKYGEELNPTLDFTHSNTNFKNTQAKEDFESFAKQIKSKNFPLQKDSYPTESLIRKVTENVIRKLTESIVNSDNKDWCGIKGVHFIWHGEWADPELEYNGLVVNYHELEDYYWADFQEEYPKPKEMSDDVYDKKFYNYLNSKGEDIISYIKDNGEPEVDEKKEKEMNDKIIDDLRQKHSWWDDTIPIV